jgi:hypothetical protein
MSGSTRRAFAADLMKDAKERDAPRSRCFDQAVISSIVPPVGMSGWSELSTITRS